VRRREGRRRSKESEALGHGFDGEGSGWPWYWDFSGEEFLSDGGASGSGSRGRRERGV
jgi:hypothetical protein